MKKHLCGAKTRSGDKCKHEAGWGTDHVGTGRCRLHGGCSPKGPDSPQFKHGERSKYFDVTQIEGFAEWKERQVGPAFDLEDDMLALIYMTREMLLKNKPVPIKVGKEIMFLVADPAYLTLCLDRISKVWERIVKRHEGETVYVKLAQPQVEAAFRAMGEAVARHVSDPNEAEALRADLEAALEKIAEGDGA